MTLSSDIALLEVAERREAACDRRIVPPDLTAPKSIFYSRVLYLRALDAAEIVFFVKLGRKVPFFFTGVD